MYLVRTDTGICVADLSNHVAERIIRNSKGHFRNLNYQTKNSSNTKIVWQFDEDLAYGNEGFRIMLYNGFLLIPE